MVKNCITMAKTWQQAGDKGNGKDKGKDIGKVQGMAQAKARAEDKGEGKGKAEAKAEFFRTREGSRWMVPKSRCINRGHEGRCYEGKPTHWTCGLALVGSLKAARRAGARKAALWISDESESED